VKLLIYSHFFRPSVGGVETIVESLARGLADFRTTGGEAEFDVTIVTQAVAGEFKDNSFPFRVVRQPTLRKLWHLVRTSDVVHLAGPSLAPLFLAWLSRKPVVLEHHGYQAICPNGILVYQPDGTICPGYFQARRYEKCWGCQNSQLSRSRSVLGLILMFPRYWLARMVSRNLAITKHVLERHKLPRAQVVYYGIGDPFGMENSSIPEVKGSGKVCFAFVGRFVPEKGIPIFLKAARLLMKEGYAFEVRLIGDGPERAKIESIIKRDELDDYVRITGYLAGAPLAEALKDVSVVVMPSIWEETAGLAAIEQMMRGRLVIASEIGGLSEIVGNTGLCFPAGNADALAERMKTVLRVPALSDSMGQQARQRALHLFARHRMIEEHAGIYAELLQYPPT